MQTSSKIDKCDNWKDLNLDNIMNIRPRGTYKKPCCHHPHIIHHPHCHNNYNCDCCDINPFTCPHANKKPHKKPQHISPCHNEHKCECCDINPFICPHADKKYHQYPIDIDGDGFVESDIIRKPIPIHPKPCPVPPVEPPCNCQNDSDELNDTTEYYETEDTINENELSPVYGINNPIEDTELNEVLTDIWNDAQIVETNEQNEVSIPEIPTVEEINTIEEPVNKPLRTRRVNRGGRRKKES